MRNARGLLLDIGGELGHLGWRTFDLVEVLYDDPDNAITEARQRLGPTAP